MTLELQILSAVGLDLLIGDPRWLPHPVRGIGRLAARLESLFHRSQNPTLLRLLGLLTSLCVYATAGVSAWLAIHLAGRIHPLAADIVSIVVIYTTIAARDLISHSLAVFRPLSQGNLAAAREKLRFIVGRDTDTLDEAEIARAAVESVAESTVYGVTAPLFFAFLFGPVGAIVYRAINTLDSMFGHKDERYLYFGWASARIDDIANFLPARLTAPLVAIAALLLGHNATSALRTLLRDGRKHESPNAGLAEASMAGALNVQLGGVNYYDGQPLPKPTLGQPRVPLIARHILHANALMLATVLLFTFLGFVVRWRIHA